jgi:hypothetical protein
MAKATQQQFEDLLTKAARDASFRDKLIATPGEAARDLGVELDDDDIAKLAEARPDLERFGGNPQLHPDDAKSWSVGVFHVRFGTAAPKSKKP